MIFQGAILQRIIKWGLATTDVYIFLHKQWGALQEDSQCFNKETHANENVYQLFSICFQRQILKADHAKRNHAHREEIHSVL